MAGSRVLAVAGTHGKTTTTALLTSALLACGLDPTYAVGGVLTATGRNADAGSGDLFVAEADESDGAFLVYEPFAAVVTNVAADHLDVWGTEQAYREAFDTFARHVHPDGFLVCCVDDPGARDLAAAVRARGGDRGRRRRVRGRGPAGAGPRVRRRDVLLHRGRPGRRAGPRHAAHPGPALRPRRAGGAGRRAGRRRRLRGAPRRSRVVHGIRAADGAQGRGRRRPGLRQLRPPSAGDQRRPAGRPVHRRRGPAAGGLPAAPGLPDPDLRAGDGRGPRRRRRGGGARGLPRPRGRRPGGDRRAGGRRRPPPAGGGRSGPPPWPTPRPRSWPGPGPATWSSPSGPATSPGSARRLLARLEERADA